MLRIFQKGVPKTASYSPCQNGETIEMGSNWEEVFANLSADNITNRKGVLGPLSDTKIFQNLLK